MSSLSLTSATIVPRTALSQHSSISSIINTNTNVQPANDNQLKRRRQDDESSQIDGEPFEIRSTSTSEVLIYAYPCYTLPRASLPLAFLDFSQRSDPIIPRIFASSIDSLELDDIQYSAEPIVLIAKAGKERALYAIESIGKNVYSGNRLTQWVKLDDLEALSQQRPRFSFKKQCRPAQSTTQEWWSNILLERSTIGHSEKTIKLESDDDIVAISTNDVQALPGLPAPDSIGRPQPIVHKLASPAGPSLDATKNDAPESSLEDSFASVSTNYLDMLYTSRAPLAYFVKGPLSRARSAYSTAEGQLNKLHELADLLRLMVLSTSALDKKYKESIPNVIKTLSSADISPEKPKSIKRKKIRKFKPAKDGLFPDETDSLHQWWVRDMTGSTLPPTAESLQAAMKVRITGLRLREYLLQLILILEVIAIEASIAKASSKAGQSIQDTQAMDAEDQVAEKGSTAKTAQKPRDLQPLVETIIDRLQIWQSVSSVEGEHTTEENEFTEDGMNIDAAAGGTTRDDLKEFCVEVVVPFYASRLGKVAERIARKLGVQTAPSPVKRKSAQKDPPARPGAALSHEDASKSRRSLHRVSTTGGRSGSGQPPTLMRSATDTLLQEIARERSNSPNVSFNAAGGAARSFSRSSSINHSKQVNQREVEKNLYAKPKQDSRKNVAEKELQEAIATLRKPNRGTAVKEIADAADMRKIATTQKKPTMSRTQSQVMATPRRSSKTKDVVSATPSRSMTQPDLTLQDNPFLASATSRIPSSGHRPAWSVEGRSQAPLVDVPSISETPSKPGGRTVDSLKIMHNSTTIVDKSPIPAPPIFKAPPSRKVSWNDQSITAQVAETPRKARTSAGPGRKHSAERIGSPEMEAIMSSPVAVRKSNVSEMDGNPAGSIYDSLGWDDDDIL